MCASTVPDGGKGNPSPWSPDGNEDIDAGGHPGLRRRGEVNSGVCAPLRDHRVQGRAHIALRHGQCRGMKSVRNRRRAVRGSGPTFAEGWHQICRDSEDGSSGMAHAAGHDPLPRDHGCRCRVDVGRFVPARQFPQSGVGRLDQAIARAEVRVGQNCDPRHPHAQHHESRVYVRLQFRNGLEGALRGGIQLGAELVTRSERKVLHDVKVTQVPDGVAVNQQAVVGHDCENVVPGLPEVLCVLGIRDGLEDRDKVRGFTQRAAGRRGAGSRARSGVVIARLQTQPGRPRICRRLSLHQREPHEGQ